MIAVFETVSALFLIAYSFHPLQGLGYAGLLAASGLVIWIICGLVHRSLLFFSTRFVFYLILILSFGLRAGFADGNLMPWFAALAGAQWLTVLLLSAKGKHELAPGIFLIASLIFVFYVSILDHRTGLMPGLPIWILLVLHTSLLALSLKPLRIGWPLLAFVGWSLVCVPLSLYAWNSLQFVWWNISGILVFSICKSYRLYSRIPLLAAYGIHAGALVLYTISVDWLPVKELGLRVFGLRHYFVDHPNTVAPFLTICTAMIVGLGRRSYHPAFRSLAMVLIAALAGLQILGYSRAGWIGYASFWASLIVLKTRRIPELRKRIFFRAIAATILIASLLFGIGSVREAVATRWQDTSSMSQRLFDWNLGIRTVTAYPLFGVGWLNYYAHTFMANSPETVLRENQNVIAVHAHSFYLDLAEAGGAPLLLLFLFILISALKPARKSPVFLAGLIGLSVNNLLDTAALWPVLYPHLWILLAFNSGSFRFRSVALRAPLYRILLPTLFLLCFLLPAASDHFLTRFAFYLLQDEDASARRSARIASAGDPLNVLPLERLRDLYLAKEEDRGAENVLQDLMRRKQKHAAYYAELGRLQLLSYRAAEARNHLDQAVRLDPGQAMRTDALLSLASLHLSEGNRMQFQESLCRYLLFEHGAENSFTIRSLLENAGGRSVIGKCFQMAAGAGPQKNRDLSVTNLQWSLKNIRETSLEQEVLQEAVAKKNLFSVETLDYFVTELASIHFRAGNREAIARLIPQTTPEAAGLLLAQTLLLEKQYEPAERKLKETLDHIRYQDLSEWFSTLYGSAKQPELLRRHYRMLNRLPPYFRGYTHSGAIARSYLDEKRFSEAAREYRKLSRQFPEAPNWKWWEARCWWLAGRLEKAEKANSKLLSRIRPNPMLREFYRSQGHEIVPWTTEVRKEALPNRIGGLVSHTGIFAHAPSSISLSEEYRSIQGKIALIGGAWFNETDGVVFEILNRNREQLFRFRIDPKNPSHRQWIDFEWHSNSGPQEIILRTDPIGNANYDWSMWVIEEVR